MDYYEDQDAAAPSLNHNHTHEEGQTRQIMPTSENETGKHGTADEKKWGIGRDKRKVTGV